VRATDAADLVGTDGRGDRKTVTFAVNQLLTGGNPASPLMDWDSPVLYPGDPERAIAGKRRREGIPLADKTVAALNEAATRLDCPPLT